MRNAFSPARVLLLAWLVLAALALPLHAQQPSAQLKELQETSNGFYRAGDYAQALRFAEQALPLVIREFGPEHERTGVHYFGLGDVAELAGNLTAAQRYFAESVRVREKVYGTTGPASAGTAIALRRLGAVHVKLGQPDAAEPLLRRALQISQSLVGRNDAYAAGSHSDLGDASLARGNWAAALASYREAIRLLAGQDTSQAVSRSIAEDAVKRARDTYIGLNRAAWRMQDQAGSNRAALLEEAFAAAQQAWNTSAASALARMTARLGASETDLGRRIRRLQDLSELTLRTHGESMRLLTEWNAVMRGNPAYNAVFEEFNAAAVARSKNPAAVNNADFMALLQRLGAAEKALPGYAEHNARRLALNSERERADAEARSARSGLVKDFPAYDALADPKPLKVAEAQALLRGDEALVAILVGSTRSFVWALTRERAEWAQIEAGAQALSEQVAALRLGLDPLAQQDAEGGAGSQAGVAQRFDLARAHALYRLVLAPVAATFAGKRHLIVVPTGALTSLPLQVLVTAPPAPAGTPPTAALRDAAWLIKSYALSVLPSVQSFSALRRLPVGSAGTRPFFGMGDPVLEGPDPADRQRSAKRRSASMPARYYRNGLADVRAVRELTPLPDTADELKTIAQVLGAPADAVNLREAASETKVKSAPLSEYRVVHFATHGLVAGDLSGLAEPALVLTPPDVPTEADDGLLAASEIATLRLNADWVVLSACNTAAGGGEGAEALSGLARAFFYAGARALLVSHWAVYSTAATELTTKTFANLAASPGIGRSEAFRQAMLGLIAAGKPPAYWAPFVVVGEGGATAR